MGMGKATSSDGTAIAYWTSGEGPPLVLVHGITSTHLTYDELVPHLVGDRTVTVYDRRGRGDSGDSSGEYSFDDEISDLLAVVDELGQHPVDVFAHSFGAFVAAGAARRDDRDRFRKMVFYSPGFGEKYPPSTLARIDELVQAGERDQALEVLLVEIIGMPHEEVDFMRKSRAWQARIESVHTVARECRADQEFSLDSESLGSIEIPVLVISGETNPPNKKEVASRLAEVMGDATLATIAGEGHVAHHTAPDRLARMTLDFTG